MRNVRRNGAIAALVAVILLVSIVALWIAQRPEATTPASLRVALAPYQDMAMLVNYEHLGLDSRYGLDLDLVTVPWEDLYPTVASAGRTVDVAFGGLIEYMNKAASMNRGTDDPVLYIYPAYVFKGAAFITYNDLVPDLRGKSAERALIRKFLEFRIGAQRYSTNHMMLFDLAAENGIPFESLRFFDIPENDALLAARNGSLDVAGAGLTQRAEAIRTGGRVVLDSQVAGFADVTGFVCKRSTLVAKRAELEKLIRIWFDSVAYVTAEPTKNSTLTLEYLAQTSATDYTPESFVEAIQNEYFPTSVSEANRELVSREGEYAVPRIAQTIASFLQEVGLTQGQPPAVTLIDIDP